MYFVMHGRDVTKARSTTALACVGLAALALIAGGCVKLDAIYRIIDWKIIVLVAGTLPLSTALAKTGATAMIADGMVAVLAVR